MKVRFDGLDVMAMVSHLQGNNASMLGRRVVNVYDDNDRGEHQSGGGDTYIFKFDGGGGSVANSTATTTAGDHNDSSNSSKAFLTMQSGIRFHDTPHHAAEASCMPTPFCSKLRKHLRGLRLQKIQQIGLDRVVIFTFMGGGSAAVSASGASGGGGGSNKCFLILELYAKGNLILTDQDYKILALLRSHAYQEKKKTTTNVTVNGDGAGAGADAAPSNNDDTTHIGSKNSNKAEANKDQNNKDTVAVQVGQIYPVTYAATVDVDGQDDKNNNNFLEWVTHQLTKQQDVNQQQPHEQPQPQPANNKSNSKKKKSSSGSSSSSCVTLKTLLLRPGSGFSQYGPALLEHCILVADLVPHQAIANGLDSYTPEQWQHLECTLQTEAPRILQELQQTATTTATSGGAVAQHTGYLLYQPRTKTTASSNDDHKTKDAAEKHPEQHVVNHHSDDYLLPAHADKILQEFQPVLLKQHESRHYIKCRDFGQAVAQFFGQLQSQKNLLKAQAAEVAARQRLEKVRNDQASRVATLELEQVRLQQCAALVQARATQVDQALMVINSALDAGMDWDQLEQLVQVEKEQNQNPIAQLIQELQLDEDAMILRLPLNEYNDNDDEDHDNDGNEHDNFLDVQVFLNESAHANASRLFAKYRASKEKSQKTIEASSMALKAAEESAHRQLLEAQKKKGGGGGAGVASMGRRRLAWYEKFHWFITSENYLVLAGKVSDMMAMFYFNLRP
jgi:predicted ribosome quality control (RQC) complex YloA/Tae2 family protein